MTMFFDDEFDKIFKRMSKSFFEIDDMFEDLKKGEVSGPVYYGYSMTIGPDGKPVIKEYGNVKPGLLPTSQSREPLVETFVDDKEKKVKLVAEIPGVEKTNIKIIVENEIIDISAESGEKKYHTKVPIKQKVDQNSARASYKNGILEVTFKLLEEKKTEGKILEVE